VGKTWIKLAKVAMQPNIEIYTWQSCPYCIRAKALLKSKGVEFTEYSVDGDEQARSAMAKRANGRRSVPQIFIDDAHIGGCDDLHDLDYSGKLDTLLGIT
jgi:glutaredoxin 3